MELKGIVKRLFPIQSGVSQTTGNEWKRQEFLFEFFESASDIFARRIKLSIRNEKISELSLQEGDEINVRVSLTCREYPEGSGKFFNDVLTGMVEKTKKNEEPEAAKIEEKENDLPFD